MISMTCPTDHELLPLLTEQSGMIAVREHVASCLHCRDRLQRLECEVRTLREIRGDPSSPPPCEPEPPDRTRLAGELTDRDETVDHRIAG